MNTTTSYVIIAWLVTGWVLLVIATRLFIKRDTKYSPGTQRAAIVLAIPFFLFLWPLILGMTVYKALVKKK